jgi:hypothetical protein
VRPTNPSECRRAGVPERPIDRRVCEYGVPGVKTRGSERQQSHEQDTASEADREPHTVERAADDVGSAAEEPLDDARDGVYSATEHVLYATQEPGVSRRLRALLRAVPGFYGLVPNRNELFLLSGHKITR